MILHQVLSDTRTTILVTTYSYIQYTIVLFLGPMQKKKKIIYIKQYIYIVVSK